MAYMSPPTRKHLGNHCVQHTDKRTQKVDIDFLPTLQMSTCKNASLILFLPFLQICVTFDAKKILGE